jgi:hypothetical protein
LYKDLGTFVQKEVSEALKKPTALINKVRGLGYWYLRKKRMEKAIACYPPYYDIEGYNDFDSESSFLKFLNKQELYKIFKARLKDYEKYLEVRKTIKEKRNEFNSIHGSKEDSNQTSKD